MAGPIRGITIEFRGETTELDRAIKKVNKETKSLDSDLRKVNNALKFNPTSVELWRQKQDLLKKKISETNDKLKLLKEQQKNMDAAGVDKNSVEYQRLRREIIQTESQLKTFKGQLRGIGNVKLRAASEQFKVMGDKLTQAGQALRGFSMAGAAAVATIGALAYKGGQLSDELNTLSKKYGIATDNLQMYAAAAELVDVDVDTIAKSHVKLEKNMYSAANGSKSMAGYFDQLGISLTDANGELRSSDEVWMDVIAALGQMENETERDAIAMQLLGKSAAELNPIIEDGGETYKQLAETLSKYNLNFIDQETLDAANQFTDSLDTMKAIGSVALQTIGAQLAAYLAPALEKIVDLVGRFCEWLSQLDPRLLTIIAAIGGVIAVVAPLLTGLGQLAFAISSIISLMGVIGPAIGGVMATAVPVIAIIGAIIAIGITLYKNWDLIKAKAQELWATLKAKFEAIKTSITNAINNVKAFLTSAWATIKSTAASAWENIRAAIVTPIERARDRVRAIIEKIKGWFPIKIGNLMSNIKLPHFNWEWQTIVGNIKIPKFKSPPISWYKTGGIFDSPSLIGIGEAGAEAVVPLDTLWQKLDRIADASGAGGGITINVYGAAGQDPNAIAAAVRRELIAEVNRRRLAWQ